jgi:hypothetical protein
MHKLIPSLFAACLLVTSPVAQTKDKTGITRALAGDLVQVRHWSEIPAPVRKELTDQWKSDWIADPGEPFQVTDVIGPEKLPGRRLVIAARGTKAWIICYETGGIAHLFHLAIVPFEADKVRGDGTWLMLRPPITDLSSIRDAVRDHRYSEERTPQ